MFYDILAQACAEMKLLDEKVTSPLGFSIFEFLFPLSFFSFSFLFAAVIDFLLGLLVVKKILRVTIAANFYHGAAWCSGKKFCSEFFTHLF